MSRFECHSHTMYSNLRLLDCINSPKKLVNRAIELGLKGIAITDHEALGSHMEIDALQRELIEQGSDFKVAKGNEIYLCDTRDKGQKYYHYILIAKDAIGHKMLRKLSSQAWMQSYYDRGIERVPTLKSELEGVIREFGKGHLIASTACIGGEVGSFIIERETARNEGRMNDVADSTQRIKEFVNWNKGLFGNDFYLEVQPGRSDEQMLVNKTIGKLGKFCGVKVIVSTDAHYLSPSERNIHRIYLNSKGGEREVDAFYEYAYLQSTEEVIENLDGTGLDYQELEQNTLEIYDKIENYTLAKKQHVREVSVSEYPKERSDSHFYDPEIYPTLDKLKHSDNPQERYWVNYCQEQLEAKGLYNDTYLARLEEEADIKATIGQKLETCMFAYPIFLQHYIDLFWECGSTVGAGRGSACSGLNHFLLGVTQLDPIKERFPFWRYLNKERVELGDIDIDIAPSKRELIFQKIREERGKLGCVQVCTYGTETTKSAISTVARGMGIDNDVSQYMTSLIPQERGFLWPLSDVINGNKEKGRKPVKQFLAEANRYPGFIEAAIGIEGIIKQRGIHASGVIFYDDDPYEDGCFMKATNGSITTQFSLHDAEAMGNVKYDFLVTEVQDVITQTIGLLQKYGKIEPELSLREAYNKYLHPYNLPLKDVKLWDALNDGKVIKCFQFEGGVGRETLKKLKPRNVFELATCNSIMRLMAPEKGAEQPSDRYARMKANIQEWYDEMNQWGLTRQEQGALERYCLSSYGTPAQQEDVMLMLMDKDICGFTLGEANSARKVISKKNVSEIPKLRDKIINKASSARLGKYIFEVLVKLQLGYSFSVVHTGVYSYIGLQTVYLATYFPSVYWNTACLRVDSGLDDDASSNYRKMAKAIGNMQANGIKVSTADINRSGYMFEPDEASGAILYGLKGINGVGGDVVQEIVSNRPYASFEDFHDHVPLNKTALISLIKAGAFDEFGSRESVMTQYLSQQSEPKSKLTMQNLAGLIEKGLVPNEFSLEKRTFAFNKALRANCKNGEYFKIQGRYDTFYQQFFDIDQLEVVDNVPCISIKTWQKTYTKFMAKLKAYIADHQEELLEKYNATLLQGQWEKYANGNQLKWEMEALGLYAHGHELQDIDMKKYGIVDFSSLSEEPVVAYKTKGKYSVYELSKICGTVIAKDDNKSIFSLLTVNDGVVDVRLPRELYAYYNKRVSQIDKTGVKKVLEDGWFSKGTLLIVFGFRRGSTFVAKKYKSATGSMLYKITSVNGADISVVGKRIEIQ